MLDCTYVERQSPFYAEATMGLTYTGGEKGSEHPGLPERDLKEGEMKEFGGRDQLEGTGLYVVEPRDVKPGQPPHGAGAIARRKPSAKQMAQRAAAKKKSVAKKAVAFTRRANVELKRATAVVKADVASRAEKAKVKAKAKANKAKKAER